MPGKGIRRNKYVFVDAKVGSWLWHDDVRARADAYRQNEQVKTRYCILNFLPFLNSSTSEFQSLRDEIKNNTQDEKHALRISLESAVEKLFKMFQQAQKVILSAFYSTRTKHVGRLMRR